MKHHPLAAAHAVATHLHVSTQDTRIYVVTGLLLFVAVAMVYEAAVKRQPHDMKLGIGALLMVGILYAPFFAVAFKIYVVAGFIIAIFAYLVPHGLFRRQAGEIFAAIALLPAFALLTAPVHYLIPLFSGSV